MSRFEDLIKLRLSAHIAMFILMNGRINNNDRSKLMYNRILTKFIEYMAILNIQEVPISDLIILLGGANNFLHWFLNRRRYADQCLCGLLKESERYQLAEVNRRIEQKVLQ